MDIHPSALKHGVEAEDIEHALANAMVIEVPDDDTRLCIGASRNGALLEVLSLIRGERSDLVIHAMPMRAKYRRLLPGG